MSMNIAIKTGHFTALENKAGKITASAEKRAALLNELESGKSILAVALHGKGAMQRQAAASFQAPTLEGLLASPIKLDGDQVSALRALLINAYGEGSYSRATMKGLDGLRTYLQAVACGLESRMLATETASQYARASARLSEARGHAEQVQNLIALRDADIAAQKAAEAEAEAAAKAAIVPTAKAKAKAEKAEA